MGSGSLTSNVHYLLQNQAKGRYGSAQYNSTSKKLPNFRPVPNKGICVPCLLSSPNPVKRWPGHQRKCDRQISSYEVAQIHEERKNQSYALQVLPVSEPSMRGSVDATGHGGNAHLSADVRLSHPGTEQAVFPNKKTEDEMHEVQGTGRMWDSQHRVTEEMAYTSQWLRELRWGRMKSGAGGGWSRVSGTIVVKRKRQWIHGIFIVLEGPEKWPKHIMFPCYLKVVLGVLFLEYKVIRQPSSETVIPNSEHLENEHLFSNTTVFGLIVFELLLVHEETNTSSSLRRVEVGVTSVMLCDKVDSRDAYCLAQLKQAPSVKGRLAGPELRGLAPNLKPLCFDQFDPDAPARRTGEDRREACSVDAVLVTQDMYIQSKRKTIGQTQSSTPPTRQSTINPHRRLRSNRTTPILPAHNGAPLPWPLNPPQKSVS
ncbi:hypothetical protein DFH07DRAFT_1013186 [Mycena maculata]|uniref:Uncharacterized protein n=1 Tax=Mycena maculata TaxID=230809 RepID=A0AAD7MGV6_9AGAR|nr:hypothetical protein DFH07DRAFT_1013186 [Mycena maculata]